MPQTDLRERARELYHNLTFGCELEFTGITRTGAASILQTTLQRLYPNSQISYYKEADYGYNRHIITVNPGNMKWIILKDASVTPLKRSGGRLYSASDLYKCELTTPPLTESSIWIVQEVVRALRHGSDNQSENTAGKDKMIVSENCGCHIHVGIKELKPKQIVAIINNVYSKQELLLKAIGLSEHDSRYRYTQKLPEKLVRVLKKRKIKSLCDIRDIWYDVLGTSTPSYEITQRYSPSRYHILNLCRGLEPISQWYLGTAEFRLFNSTTHAGQLRSYIELCLKLVSYCACVTKSSYKQTIVGEDESAKYKFRCWLLKLDCISDEFKTLRKFLLENFGTQSSAWRRGQRF